MVRYTGFCFCMFDIQRWSFHNNSYCHRHNPLEPRITLRTGIRRPVRDVIFFRKHYPVRTTHPRRLARDVIFFRKHYPVRTTRIRRPARDVAFFRKHYSVRTTRTRRPARDVIFFRKHYPVRTTRTRRPARDVTLCSPALQRWVRPAKIPESRRDDSNPTPA
jgi:hypothetical protein